jgi:hypothetical protein
MATNTSQTIINFTSNFGDTPYGNSTPNIQYKSGVNYIDNMTSMQTPPRIAPNNKHTAGELANTSLIPTKFLSVDNPIRDTSIKGVNLLVFSPQAINYTTNGNVVMDPRAYVKFFFSGVQFLKLNGSELTP